MRPDFRRLIPAILILAACSSGGDAAPTGALTVTVSGLPSGPAAIMVTGPNNYSHSVTATTTLSGLPSGTYTVAASNVVIGTATYAATPPTTGVSITSTTLTAPVNYTVASGGLALTVSGLPGGVNANVTVTGPGGFSQVATASKTWTNLTPGSYVVTAIVVASGSSTYGGAPPTQTIVVPASLTNATATETYSLMTGQITVTINGLPGGLNPSVLVTGPFAYSHPITVSGASVLSALPLGTYTIAASNVSNATATYAPAAASQTVTLAAGALSGAKTVSYAISTGSLTVTVTGLPGGTNSAITVTGPSSFSQSVTATTTINKLVPGTYTTTASNVTVGATVYVPSPTSQTSAVTASITPVNAPVAYAAASGLDLTIDGMYITQSTQTYLGTIPLVKDRDGYLRVFVKANQANSAAPKVRVRWYSSGTLIRTDTISAPSASVPTVIAEGTLNSSWNLAIPKTLIQPNLSVLADVDPGNLIPEGVENNNSFPVSGVAQPLSVHTESVFHITLVPVKMNAAPPDSGTGNVTAANQDSYLGFLQKIDPIPSYAITLHAKYVTNDTLPLISGDGNFAWDNVLSELAALRGAESAPQSQYYYGIVHPNYGGGVAGLGYIGFPAAMGWDRSISDKILAHEVGHNWGRWHAPCGSPAMVDPSWPSDAAHANALIGAYGFDVQTATLKDKAVYTDVMSYCQSNQWISDYTYQGIMAYREANPDVVSDAAASAAEPVLLVWGHMSGNRLILEPAFEITATPSMPDGHGEFTIEGLDASGMPLFSHAFDAAEIMDSPSHSHSFMFKIPLRSFDASRLASLRLSGHDMEARVDGGPAVAAMSVGSAPPSGLIARLRGALAHVTWDRSMYPMALIRDARTGEVLSFARYGSVDVAATGDLVVVLSNGVRSVTERVTAQ